METEELAVLWRPLILAKTSQQFQTFVSGIGLPVLSEIGIVICSTSFSSNAGFHRRSSVLGRSISLRNLFSASASPSLLIKPPNFESVQIAKTRTIKNELNKPSGQHSGERLPFAAFLESQRGNVNPAISTKGNRLWKRQLEVKRRRATAKLQ